MLQRNTVLVAILSCFSTYSIAATALNYSNQTVTETEAIPEYKALTSDNSTVTFQETVGNESAHLPGINIGSVTAKNQSHLIFAKGLYAGSSGYQKSGLNVSGNSVVEISGVSRIDVSGAEGVAIAVEDGGLLKLENASLSMSGSGNLSTGLKVTNSTVEISNSVVSTGYINRGLDTQMEQSTLRIQGESSFENSKLDANNSKLDFSGSEGQSVQIGKLSGDNIQYSLNDSLADISITESTATNLTLVGSGTVNDAVNGDLNKAKSYFGIRSGNQGDKLILNEGMYEGEKIGLYDENNNLVSQTTKTNTLMQSTLELASAAPLAMNRIMMSDLRKRMGDIRTDTNTNGAWARYEGGRLSGSNGLENDFNTIQVGGDTKLGDWRVGGAFNYTTGDVDYARGDADMDSYGLSAYGLWLGEQGQFVDIVARVSKADTDMKVDGFKTGSMDSMAYSLSGEFGWRFALNDMVYVEPQVEAAYTYVDADDLDIDTASYKFDSVNSFIGRAGFAAGLKCPDNFGDVYFHASALHEFSGDSEITGGNGSKYKIDGKDTWVEYGIGANFNINKATYVWADVQRTSGADLDEDWRANVGVRYSF